MSLEWCAVPSRAPRGRGAVIRIYDAASIVTEMHEHTRGIPESSEVLARIALLSSLEELSNVSAFVGLLPGKRPDSTE